MLSLKKSPELGAFIEELALFILWLSDLVSLSWYGLVGIDEIGLGLLALPFDHLPGQILLADVLDFL